MNEKDELAGKSVQDFINGIGVIAETTKLHYDALLKVGFTRQNALYLTGEFMKIMVKTGKDDR